MTTIVLDILNKTMYSDSQVTIDDEIHKQKKIFKINNIIYGVCCENYYDLREAIDWIEGKLKKKPKKKFKSSFEILVLQEDGRAFVYQNSLMEAEVQGDFYCIGTGAVYIQTVLDYQKKYNKKTNIKRAIDLALDKDIYSSGPVQKLSF